ncbi:hypothetical protein GON03_04635 [Nocardioides sp. MAH-18]|uniref:LPXTG cell wall anchor domain-containing protein n=1 Tax=Nocardioides agri TaxID=2682843 RepID=A0A6L6XS49_9ACTN|nr:MULTISPECIES: hypothetical protein [unclassified Nocardioides]MBA2953588.1 hypothetical protein [Nocardioides sp. CGMCC 1.13656]MVQ48455.1 hypothetical protein [Nocardioides sp. MAH-18]
MRKLGLSLGLRHPLAAVLAVCGLVLGTVAAFSGSASAAAVTLDLKCVTTIPGSSSNAFDWPGAQVDFSATGPAGATVTVKVSDMPGIAPVKMMNFPGTSRIVLTSAGVTTTLNGSGPVSNSGAKQPVPVPDLTGKLDFEFTSLAAVFTSLNLTVSGISTDCTLPTATPSATPTVPPPTTTASATATPTAAASASPSTSPSKSPTSGASKGEPAEGDVEFACVLNPLGTKFEYPATVTVSGSRAQAKDDLSVSATMSDLPGISPVPIDGQMDVTLDLVVATKKTTIEGTTHAVAAAKAPVKVPTLSGKLAVDGDEVDVSVTGFTFNFAALAIDADCQTDAVAMGAMKVGSEPVDDETGSGSGSGSGSGTSGGGLPQTGGGDALPVIALWAIALSLLGAALLLIVPGAVRPKA